MISTPSPTTPSSAPHPATELVLFDMGGVLVELGTLHGILGLTDEGDFWPRWLSSDVVRRFERGRCSVEEFGAGLVDEFELARTPEELVDEFARFPRGLYAGAAELVADVARHTTTGLLSNTNAVHWERQPDAARIQSLTDRHYLSFELDLLKPDAEIFEHIVADTGLDPAAIVFLDDNQVNVDGARSVGLRAERARGVGEARRALEALGVLDDDSLSRSG